MVAARAAPWGPLPDEWDEEPPSPPDPVVAGPLGAPRWAWDGAPPEEPPEVADYDDEAPPEPEARGRRARRARAARGWNDEVEGSQRELADGLLGILARGYWRYDGVVLDDKQRKILASWASRIAECAPWVKVSMCSSGCGAQGRGACCRVPLCPREQKRRAARWGARAGYWLSETMPNQADGLVTWKFATFALRGSGDVWTDVERHLKLRGQLVRYLRGEGYGAEAGKLDAVGAVELGDEADSGAGHVHLHMLVYTSRLDREELQRWLRSKDCTRKGCPHPADDRCDACKAAKHACVHPDGRRERCNGSWVVDIVEVRCKACKDLARRTRRRVICRCSSSDGLREALKYAAAPVLPDRHAPTTERAERVIRYFSAMYRRHRVETYGRCREVAPGEEEAAEVAEGLVDAEPERPAQKRKERCRKCGKSLYLCLVGHRSRDLPGYVWTTSGPRARAGPQPREPTG